MATTVLDTPIFTLTAITHRRLFDKVIRTVMLDAGVSYADAYAKIDQGIKDAYERERQPTVRTMLEEARIDCDFVGNGVNALDRADKAIRRADKRATRRLSREKVDDQGRVILSADDAGRILGSPVRQERRLARARQIQPGQFDGEAGRQRFLADDKLYLETGRDLLRTIERPAEERKAQAPVIALRRQLDAAFASAGDRHQRLRLLETEIAKLSDLEGQRRELQSTEAGENRQRLRLLDQGKGKKPKKPKKPKATLTRDRLEQLRATQTPGEFVKTLNAYVASTPPLPKPERAAPPKPERAKDPTAPPPGVHEGSHELHRRVLDRIDELDLNKDRDYAKVLDQMVREGGA